MSKLIPAIRSGYRFQWEPAQDCHVLLYPEGMVKLNESAAAILGLCDAKRSTSDIVAEPASRYPDANLIAEDIEEFLKIPIAENWVEYC